MGVILNTIKVLVTILILAGIALSLFRSFVIVPESHVFIVERLGKYHRILEPGLNFIMPFTDYVVKKINKKEFYIDSVPQNVITKDNVSMQIDSVVYVKIMDPLLYTYSVSDPIGSLEMLTSTTLRNIIGDLELDATLTSRSVINSELEKLLDEATDEWGIHVLRVEIQNIIPPTDIQKAMEKQMRAERERRERILRAEGQKHSEILVAEGKKASTLLLAQAKKESKILMAEANKEERLLRAEAERESIKMVYEGQTDAIRKFNESKPSPEYMQYEAMKSMVKMANSKSNKLIVPSDLSGNVSQLAGMGFALDFAKEKEEPETDKNEVVKIEATNKEKHKNKQ